MGNEQDLGGIVRTNTKIVATSLQSALGERPEDIRVVVAVHNRLVCAARIRGKAVFFKASSSEPVRVEAWAYERSRGVGIPVPRVLALDTSQAVFPEDFMVVEGVDGVELNAIGASQSVYPKLIRQIAAHLTALHNLEYNRFGRPDLDFLVESGVIRGQFDRWSSVLTDKLESDLSPLLMARIIDPSTADALREAIARRRDDLDGVTCPRQLHGDLGSEHIYVDPDAEKVTGFVDFADTMGGDPVFELSRFDLWHDEGESRRELLIRACELESDVAEDLDRRKLLYQALQFAGNARFEYERSGTPRRHNLKGLRATLALL